MMHNDQGSVVKENLQIMCDYFNTDLNSREENVEPEGLQLLPFVRMNKAFGIPRVVETHSKQYKQV
jgi:hypothetical protein